MALSDCDEWWKMEAADNENLFEGEWKLDSFYYFKHMFEYLMFNNKITI